MNKKYRLKNAPTRFDEVDQICINCGHCKKAYLPTQTKDGVGLPRPNTSQKFVKGFIGPMPGTWLGCKLGSHDYYWDYELVRNI